MRSASGPVKLPIANVGRFPDLVRSLGASRLPARKNPAKTDIFVPIAPIQRTPIAARRDIDENRGLPYKPRNCPRWPGSSGGGSFGAVNGPFWAGQHHRTYLNSAAKLRGRIAAAKLPGQRRTTREADLSTQQTGAQAPSRLPRPSRHDRRPQGSRRAPCARPQASERLTRASPEIPLWIG